MPLLCGALAETGMALEGELDMPWLLLLLLALVLIEDMARGLIISTKDLRRWGGDGGLLGSLILQQPGRCPGLPQAGRSDHSSTVWFSRPHHCASQSREASCQSKVVVLIKVDVVVVRVNREHRTIKVNTSLIRCHAPPINNGFGGATMQQNRRNEKVMRMTRSMVVD